MAKMSYGRRITRLAELDPERPAVTCGPSTLTRRQLEQRSNRLAHDFLERGVETGDMVTIAVANSTDWYVSMAACWKTGAIPQPVSAKLPARELQAILELAQPKLVVGVSDDVTHGRPAIPLHYEPQSTDDTPPPDAVSPAWKAPTSGGSTGRPKLIVSGDPAVYQDAFAAFFGLVPGGALVMPGPLYHNGPFIWTTQALLRGSAVALLERFDAEATLAAIEAHRAEVVYLVPTMMKRIWRLPEEVRERYDLSSLTTVWHLAEPCPDWLKQGWIDWLGAERIF